MDEVSEAPAQKLKNGMLRINAEDRRRFGPVAGGGLPEPCGHDAGSVAIKLIVVIIDPRKASWRNEKLAAVENIRANGLHLLVGEALDVGQDTTTWYLVARSIFGHFSIEVTVTLQGSVPETFAG